MLGELDQCSVGWLVVWLLCWLADRSVGRTLAAAAADVAAVVAAAAISSVKEEARVFFMSEIGVFERSCELPLNRRFMFKRETTAGRDLVLRSFFAANWHETATRIKLALSFFNSKKKAIPVRPE